MHFLKKLVVKMRSAYPEPYNYNIPQTFGIGTMIFFKKKFKQVRIKLLINLFIYSPVYFI